MEDYREGKSFALPEQLDEKDTDGETKRNWQILKEGCFPHAFGESEKKLWVIVRYFTERDEGYP